MKPTMKLRWVKREVPASNGMIGVPPFSKIIEVLQQWWAVWRDGQETPTGEWRDIPIGIEK